MNKNETPQGAETATTNIMVDSSGIAWISGTPYRVKDVIEDRLAYGWSPEEIRYQHYARLSLAQIYAAFAYYYEHQQDVDRQIGAEFKEVEELRRTHQQHDAISQKLRKQTAQK